MLISPLFPTSLSLFFSSPSCFSLVPSQLDEIYNLLSENYVEDDDCMFRFDYSREFLKWYHTDILSLVAINAPFLQYRALKPPGYRREWHVGVRRRNEGNKLVAFITAIPATISVRGR